ncbi:zinc-dependent alcohol dehydrogenase [Agromyces silvae]|uniref:zinc-dependent alcohol dehydrogenase n=1 Tax=Agromyces silvae TaxID=3388266 RepID=UPI00280C325A|nr:alcohol dehydrogenase catalytic domain-containing protein [Agromyces protaetiae]
MKAFVVDRRGHGSVQQVEPPVAGPGEAVVEVRRVGICGTDVGLFEADDARIARARMDFPLRIGHEWMGVVVELGDGVDPAWLGRRVVGDTMIGCGECDACRRGHHHVCADRIEVGVRGGWSGAFAERLLMPVASLHPLPDEVSDEAGALVEPAANAVRAVRAALADRVGRVLVIGPGTIGVLCALFAAAAGADVTLLGRREGSAALPRRLGLRVSIDAAAVARETWDAVIDATDAPTMPAFALDVVAPAGRVVLVGVSPTPSLVDSRVSVHKDATIVGVLGGSAGIAEAIEAFATGRVDPVPLIAETIGLADLDGELAGRRAHADGSPPKVVVDPRR